MSPLGQMHVFVCSLGFLWPFPAVLNILLELILYGPNRLTSDQCQEEDCITGLLADLQDCQACLFAHLTNLPVVT